MQYYEGDASDGLCSFQVTDFKCCGMCGKRNWGSAHNEGLTAVLRYHLPCGVVERII